jgi:hypothetical protein
LPPSFAFCTSKDISASASDSFLDAVKPLEEITGALLVVVVVVLLLEDPFPGAFERTRSAQDLGGGRTAAGSAFRV